MRLKLTLEYVGTSFRGWAAQPGLRTVEAELRRALGQTFAASERLAVGGRTDAGVHALGQVVSVEVEGGPPVERAADALNTALPEDIRVIRSELAPTGFHARRSALERTYRYRIWRRGTASPFELGRSWWMPGPLDEDRLSESASQLVGKHDFRAFTPTQTQHENFARSVSEAAWERRGHALEFSISAGSFLRHMVRTLVGSMIEGTPRQLAELLEGAPRAEAGLTAPPWGLYLERIEY